MGEVVTVDGVNADNELLQAVESFCQPTENAVIMREVYGMWSVMAKRAEEGDDFRAKQAIFADELRKYPQDIVITVCRNARRIWKFFPTLSEILQECETLFGFRKSLFDALKNPAPEQLETIGHYREIHRTKWKPCHYLQKITDLVGFADVSKKHHKAVDELGWLQAAKLFIDEIQPKLTDKDPELIEIYRILADIKPRIEVLESRLKEPEQQEQAAE